MLTLILIVAAFLAGAWAERGYAITGRTVLLWRKLKARGRE